MTDLLQALDHLGDARRAITAANTLDHLDDGAVIVGTVLDEHRDTLDHIRHDLHAAALEAIGHATALLGGDDDD